MRCKEKYKAAYIIGFGCMLACFCYGQVPLNKPLTAAQIPGPTTQIEAVKPAYNPGTMVNYVRSRQATSRISTEAALNGAPLADANETIQYQDGLGRPLQAVQTQFSPNGKDIIMPIWYDEFGRESLKYLPYVSPSNDGKFRLNTFSEQKTYLQGQYTGEQVFYGKTNFESSPLNRVANTMAPGNSWAGSNRGVATKYLTNNENDQVINFHINQSVHPSGQIPEKFDGFEQTYINPDFDSYYDPGTLFKTVSIDEQNHATVEYKDKSGNVILKKVQVNDNVPADYSGHDQFACTYYVYDDLDRLRFVVPPQAVTTIGSNIGFDFGGQGNLCFHYEYDSRGRMIGKKMPDADWVYMVYDKRDRLVFTQDGNMKLQYNWLATLYDVLNRPVATGICLFGGNRADLQAYVDQYTNSGNSSTVTEATTTQDLVVDNRLQGQVIYTAGTSISFVDGFTSEPGADFTAGTLPPLAGQGGGVQVFNNPLPPGNTFSALTYTYYDDYSWTGRTFDNSWNNKLNDVDPANHPEPVGGNSNATRGLVTGTRVKVLESDAYWITSPGNPGSSRWIENVSFYDGKARPIQVQKNNYQGGLDITTIRYSFTGIALITYAVHRNTAANVQLGISTKMTYDRSERLTKLEKAIYKNPTDATPAYTSTILENTYNELGQLMQKKQGRKKDDNGNSTAEPLAKQDFEYNVRGWLKGINKDYANGGGVSTPGADGNWFGMELNYDWGFANTQYNGNMSGTKWRSAGDGMQRAYGFRYDPMNRIMSADFSQKNSTSYEDDAKINFDAMMGDGVTAASAYDKNGNILAMKQWGLKGLNSDVIDDLTYRYGRIDYRNYGSNSIYEVSTDATNMLAEVTDERNDMDSKLGDFKDQTINFSYGRTIYPEIGNIHLFPFQKRVYDNNGNLIVDLSKGIAMFYNEPDFIPNYYDELVFPGITYNYLNLPTHIIINKLAGHSTRKGEIFYTYDATGNKLAKQVVEYDNIGTRHISKYTTTIYIDGFVYEVSGAEPDALLGNNTKLQFMSTEEGRMRIVLKPDNTNSYAFDYMLKDHLGNVRAVVTDQQQIDRYPTITLEGDVTNDEQRYFDIDVSNIVPKPTNVDPSNLLDYTNDNGTNNPNTFADKNATSQKMYRLKAPGNRTGLSTIIKVMAGDRINVLGKSYYHASGPTGNTPFSPEDLINSMLSVAGGMNLLTQHGATAAMLGGEPNLTTPLGFFSNSNPVNSGNNVKAGIAVVVLDDQFRYVNGYFNPVDPSSSGGYKNHVLPSIDIPKNGYIYVYCSNESNIDVFFDNLELVHTRGSLLEEDHYYPFGLTMQGISSRALTFGGNANKYKYNGKELQSNEFSDGSGLEWEDYGARMYDPQIGRWNVQDALSEKLYPLTPYNYCANVPTLLNDPSGRDWTITVNIDDNGTWNVNISFTGSIFNNSSNHDIDVEGYRNKLVSEFTKLFNKTNAADDKNGLPKMEITADIDIDIIDDKSELKKDRHLIEIVKDDDKELNRGEKTGGSTTYGRAMSGKRVILNEKLFTDYKQVENGNDVATGVHEPGHTAGLWHPGYGTDAQFCQPTPESNFMGSPRSWFYPRYSLLTTTGPTTEQVQLIYSLYNAKKLNRSDFQPQFPDGKVP